MNAFTSVAALLVAASSVAQTTVSVVGLSCTPIRIVTREGTLAVFDACGGVARVDLATFTLQGTDNLKIRKVFDVAVEGDRSLVLTATRTVVREIVGDGQTELFSTSFTTPMGQLAYWQNSIVVANMYAPALVDVRARGGSLVKSLIPNSAYAPSRLKVLTSFTDVIPLNDELLLFDRFDFRLFRISTSWAVTTVQKEHHPDYFKFVTAKWYHDLVSEPPANGAQMPSSIELGGSFEAISSCSCGGVFYALMVARDGSGGKEIAYSAIDVEKWTGTLAVDGTPYRIACDDRWLYVLDWKTKTLERKSRPRG